LARRSQRANIVVSSADFNDLQNKHIIKSFTCAVEKQKKLSIGRTVDDV
jgi:hypothetical protein